MSGDPDNPTPEIPAAEAEVSVLDQALWARFREDGDIAEFAQVWLSLQIRRMGKIASGVVLVEDPAENALVPLAAWPPDSAPIDVVKSAVAEAVGRGKGVAFGGAVAEPLIIDDEVAGVVALAPADSTLSPQELLTQIRWGKGWLQSALRRDALSAASLDQAKLAVVLEVIGALVDEKSHLAATHALVNTLARELDCAEVALGALHRGRTRLTAISDVSDFKMQTGRSRAVEEAVTEAIAQEGTVLFPPREDMHFMVDIAHRQLANLAPAGEMLTVAIYSGDRVSGALHLRKPQGGDFATGELMAAEAVAAAIGPLLEEKLRAERGALRATFDGIRNQLGMLFGPRHLGRKLAALVLVGLVLFFSFARGDFRVNADAEVEGRVVRAVGAPFDAFIRDEFARAGDVVKKGDIIATLDERDLQIELLRWTNDLGRYEGEYDKALADGDAPAARIAEANIAQSRAKADLVQQQLERSTLTVPFDAIVIEGDLSQSLGAAVRRGEELFKLAPLDSYRVTLEVNETDLDDIQINQTGHLRLAALPDRSFSVEVTRVTPRLEARDGRNFARVEARVLGDPAAIRPGMRGVAKVSVEERLLIDIYTRPMIDWFRLKLWTWMP